MAIDLGASNTRIGFFNHTMLEKYYSLTTPIYGEGKLLAQWLLDKVEKFDPWRNKIDAIVIASFGPIDYEKGEIINPPNYPARKIPLRKIFETRYSETLIILVNDAVAGAWSEYQGYAKDKDIRDLVYIALGTGVGVGIVIGGELLLGWRGDSHEAGHIVVEYKSRIPCGCGGRGHLEAILRESNNLQEYIEILSAGLASLIACYDPQLIAFGGGAFYARKINLEAIQRKIATYAFENRVPILKEHIYGYKANLYGAMYIGVEPDIGLIRLNGW